MFGELNPCGGGDPIPLLKSTLLIGRRSSCDVTLRFPNVSSHHCELELVKGYWLVRDLGSTNGIKVNGVLCDQKFLMPGDILTIARHRYEIIYEPDTEATPPEERDPFAVGLLEKAGLVREDLEEMEASSSDSLEDDDLELEIEELELEIEESPKLDIDGEEEDEDFQN